MLSHHSNYSQHSLQKTASLCGQLIFFVACCWVSASTFAQAANAAEFEWKQIESGYDFGRYELGEPDSVIRPEVFLLRFNPNRFQISVARANTVLGDNSDIRTLTKKLGGIAGINAHFFDKDGNPLGLLIESSIVRQKIQFGGKLLGGIFSIRQDGPRIERRDNFDFSKVVAAVQAGPRLIENGVAISLSSADETSRRSGVAITRKGEIIIFATVLRFPGATLADIQTMLLDPALNIKDALNLDGGGSSQLYMEAVPGQYEETFITGGDAVPVGLVVKHRDNKAR